MRILMVCKGNICRSPMAEGLLKHLCQQQALLWHVASAATDTWDLGCPADSRAIAQARKNGIDLQGHVARHFKPIHFNQFDYILVMDTENYRAVINKAQTPEHKAKVDFLLNFVWPQHNIIVPDPYYNNQFEQAWQLIKQGCEAIIKNLGPHNL